MGGGGYLTSFDKNSLLISKQKVESATIWEADEKQIEACGVFCHVLLGDAEVHPTMYKVFSLLRETAYVGVRL